MLKVNIRPTPNIMYNRKREIFFTVTMTTSLKCMVYTAFTRMMIISHLSYYGIRDITSKINKALSIINFVADVW